MPHHDVMKRAVAMLALIAVHCCGMSVPVPGMPTSELLGNPVVTGNKFVATLVGSSRFNGSFPAGIELRLVVATAYAVNLSRTSRPDTIPWENIGLPRQSVREMNEREGSADPRNRISSLLRLGNFSLLPAFNATGSSAVRIRVIAAHSSRSSSHGSVVPCTSAHHDVWLEHWGMAPRQLVFGKHMLLSGFVTFTAPPFNFRFCVKNTQVVNGTRDGTPTDRGLDSGWAEFENFHGLYSSFSEPILVWKKPSAANLEEGDFASVEVISNAPTTATLQPHAISGPANFSTFSLEDSVKLVPFGYPCTYEKESSRTDFAASTMKEGTRQYCGANAVNVTSGQWRNAACAKEGSVAGGVARVGARTVNPFATTASAGSRQDFQWRNTRIDRSHLVAFWKMPATGVYDVCVSSRWWRRAAVAMSQMEAGQYSGYARSALPVWIKAYDARSSSCGGSKPTASHCQPRKTAITIGEPTGTETFSTTDDTPGSWGEVMFTATSGSLNLGQATRWDLSWPRDYHSLVGGDMFRLVPEQYFSATPHAARGNLKGSTTIATAQTATTTTFASVIRTDAVYANDGVLTASGSGKFTMYAMGIPAEGTQDPIREGSGCFWQGSDNYGSTGHFGNPGTRCCSGTSPCSAAKWCTLSDSGPHGPTASSDLGGHPRTSFQPWSADGTASTAFGYIRFPAAGTYRVCYKRAGTSAWKVLNGTQTHRTTPNATFVPRASSAGFVFHFNDSRGETWGPVGVFSLAGKILDKQAWNYYTAPSAAAVGSVLKMVTTAESCLLSAAQSRTYSLNPGSREVADTLGSADDSPVTTASVYFFVKVPAYTTTRKFRICFRHGEKNWNALSDPAFVPHAYMTSPSEFAPLPSSLITFTAADTQSGSWGRIVFNRSFTSTPAFTTEEPGDLVRLVPNVTAAGQEVNCDQIWGTFDSTSRAFSQQANPALTDNRLGMICATPSSVEGDECYAGKLMPTESGIVGTVPYTDLVPGASVRGMRNLDATAAFVTLPPGLSSSGHPVAYKVCYRLARFSNWVEATNADGGNVLTVTTARTLALAPSQTRFTAGQYAYLTVTSAASAPVQIKHDMVKLVPFDRTCEVSAVAGGGYDVFTAISGVNSFQCLVDGTNASMVASSCQQDLASTTTRAYMTMPTVRRTRGGTVAQYRACFMARESNTSAANWHDLSGASPIVVVHSGITFTALNQPRFFGQLRLRVTSTGEHFDTRAGRDSAKLVLATVPCTAASSNDQPADAAAPHSGREVGWSADGVADLSLTDSDSFREFFLDTVLDTSVGLSYRVCFKPAAGDWFEVLEADGSERVVALPRGDFVEPLPAEVTSFTVSPAITAQYTDQPDYFGQAWSTVAVGGATATDGTSNFFTITYASVQAAGAEDSVKFVESFRETDPGSYAATGKNCLSDGIEHSFTTTASAAAVPSLNLPLDSGKYTVCVWKASSATWYQASSTGQVSQPMTIVSNRMGFAVDTATNDIVVSDLHAANGTGFGGLSANDFVYIANSTSACGASAAFDGTAVSLAKQNLTRTPHGFDSTVLESVRLASVGLPEVQSGAFTVCVQRSQDTATNATDVAPMLQRGWFQVPNIGQQLGGGSPFMAFSNVTFLNVSGCPVYNASYKLRTGRLFEVSVFTSDATGKAIEYSSGTPRYQVTAVGLNYALHSVAGECAASGSTSVGLPSSALTQSTAHGRISFNLAALSGCPIGGCRLVFQSPDQGLVKTETCTFEVQPTTIAALRFTVVPTACSMGHWCRFRLTALHSDGGIAHTIRSSVTTTMSGLTGTAGIAKSLAGNFFDLAGGSMFFADGVAEFNVLFEPSAFSTTPAETMTLTASANGQTTTPISIVVHRPVLSSVHVVDLFPVNSEGAPLPDLAPSWEPSHTAPPYTARGGDDVSIGSEALAAAPGFHLVAGQAYEIKFRAWVTVNGVSEYARTRYVVPPDFEVTVESAFALQLAAAGNAVLRGLAASESNMEPLPAVSWAQSATTRIVHFRIKNSLGCGPTCAVKFSFRGAGSELEAAVTTPVRSVATKLVVVGCATTASQLSLTHGSTCTGVTSTVNTGWHVNVSAVDDFGAVDQFFDGDIIAVLAPSAPPGLAISTVTELATGAPARGYATVTAVRGFATFVHVTVNKPCHAGCEVQMMSTWGTDVSSAGTFVAVPNTARLVAELATPLAICSSASTTQCSGVVGISPANVTNALSLIYADTRICVRVSAVDEAGAPTLYESNWIGYFARDVTQGSAAQRLSVADDSRNTGFAQRYRPLRNSRAELCFTIGGFTSARDVAITFVAQRFGTASSYWSHGETGTATVATLKVWPHKLVANVELQSVVGGSMISSSTIALSYTGTVMSVSLMFALKDHYNNTVSSQQLAPTESAKLLAFRTSAEGLQVTPSGDSRLRGSANVTLGDASLRATSTELQASVTVSGACLGCLIVADFIDESTSAHQSTYTLASPTEAVYLGSNITFFAVNQAPGAVRRLAFNPATSPLTSYWVNASAAPTTTTTNAAPTYGHRDCFSHEKVCNPVPASLNLAACDPRGTTHLGSAANSPLRMRVYVMSAADTLDDASREVTGAAQVDILNTYAVSISFGTQLLSCLTSHGSGCSRDGSTSPAQLLSAYGSTVREAVTRFASVGDADVRATSFFTVGMVPSSHLAINASTSKYDTTPSSGGSFVAAATRNGEVVSEISFANDAVFFWQPSSTPVSLSLLSVAADANPCALASATFPCRGGAGCSTPGLLQTGTLASGLVFDYSAQTIPVGVAFPITVEAHTSAGQRAAGADGLVSVQVASWHGCGNGGGLSSSAPMVHGRSTLWLNFSEPCESCKLAFRVTPSPSQSALWSTMSAVPALLEVMSSPVTITRAPQLASEVVAATATPATAITQNTTTLTVATPVVLGLVARARVGNIPFATGASTVAVSVHHRAVAAANWWWVGNGGTLRPSLAAADKALFQHFQVGTSAMRQQTTLAAYFTRTCSACRVSVSYRIDDGATTTFELPSVFAVTTTASALSLAGFVPRSVRTGGDVAVALWAVGSDDPSIPVAGVAAPQSSSPGAGPSFTVSRSTNGDGGRLQSTSWVFNATQIHRLSFTAPCDTCTVSVGGTVQFPLRVQTTATYLRPVPESVPSPGPSGTATRLALGEWRVLPIQALDDAGFVDQHAGTTGCAFPARRFMCLDAPLRIGVKLTADGISPASFPVTNSSDFAMADQGGVSIAADRMVHGSVNLNFSFTTPQRAVIPVFSTTLATHGASVSSELSAARVFAVPRFSVSVGTRDLSISVVPSTPVGRLTQSQNATFHVAAVGQMSLGGPRYVAVDADNEVVVSVSPGCPAHTLNSTAVHLRSGYAVVAVVFDAATEAGAACAISFAIGAGAGACSTVEGCRAVFALTVASLGATTFDVVRPTRWDHFDGSTTGAMHAHAGRRLRLATSVSGPDALGNLVPVTTCSNCVLSVTSSDCGFASQSSSVDSGSATAEVLLSMPDNGAATYGCSITVGMSAGSVALTGMDRASTTLTFAVTVCKSATMRFVANTSDLYRGQVLRTGFGYPFHVAMLAADGSQCLGDSQDEGTLLSLAAVETASAAPLPWLAAVNVNSTSSSTTAVPSARTSVRSVGGGFGLLVVFTNSTVNMGISGVGLRVSAASLGGTVISATVTTVVAASRLAFGRMSFPGHIVTGRKVFTKHAEQQLSTEISVHAVDGLPSDWFTSGLLTSGAPNVAKEPSEFGNDARVSWGIAPAPARSVAFPLALESPAAKSLIAGRTSWPSATWNGDDGLYFLRVVSETTGIASSPALPVTAQAVREIQLDTRGFTTAPVSAPTCSASCVLPNGTFSTRQNTTVNGGTPFLSVDSLLMFNLTVLVSDGTLPVLGDNSSVIAVTLNSNAASSASLGVPPLYATRGTLYARAVEGRAAFTLGFLGDTLLSGGVEQFASLTFSCPESRPVSLLLPGENSTNPCSLRRTVTTETFQIVDRRVTAAQMNTATVIAAKSVIKLSLGLASFQQFNATFFGHQLVSALQRRGIQYLYSGNIAQVLLLTSCTVDAGRFPPSGDLGATVCGASQTCAAPLGTSTCPPGVLGCSCPLLRAQSLVLSRFLLQNQSSSSSSSGANGTKTAVELSFELRRAESFPARTADEAAVEYSRVQSAALDALRNDADLVAGFQIEAISERSATAQVTTLPPLTTAGPPTAEVPSVPPSPLTADPSEGSSAPPLGGLTAAWVLGLILLALA